MKSKSFLTNISVLLTTIVSLTTIVVIPPILSSCSKVSNKNEQFGNGSNNGNDSSTNKPSIDNKPSEPNPPILDPKPEKPVDPQPPVTEPEKPVDPQPPVTEPEKPVDPQPPVTEPEKPVDPQPPVTEPEKPVDPPKPDVSKNSTFDFELGKVKIHERSFFDSTSLKGKKRSEIINNNLINSKFIFDNINLFVKGTHNIDSPDKIQIHQKVYENSHDSRKVISFSFFFAPYSIYKNGEINNWFFPFKVVDGKPYINQINYSIYWEENDDDSILDFEFDKTNVRDKSFFDGVESLKGKTRDEIVYGGLINKEFIFNNLELFIKGNHAVYNANRFTILNLYKNSLNGKKGFSFNFRINARTIFKDGLITKTVVISYFIAWE